MATKIEYDLIINTSSLNQATAVVDKLGQNEEEKMKQAIKDVEEYIKNEKDETKLK